VEVDAIVAGISSYLGGWEIVLILAVVLILVGAKKLPELARGNASDETEKTFRALTDTLTLWVAQGFGIGRIPFAPGTFGSLVGLVWFALLLSAGNFWLYFAGTLLGLGLAVWLCGGAEKILKQTDPASVVLDEIAAVPICFLAWVSADWFRSNQLLAPESFFTARTWGMTSILFVFFRLFDILKPWPVRQSQRLPGGWGVTIDDVLAAAYVALISLLFVL
jgi:phosphatidylglycerophosphatase A